MQKMYKKKTSIQQNTRYEKTWKRIKRDKNVK